MMIQLFAKDSDVYVNVEELWTTTFSYADAKVCHWN